MGTVLHTIALGNYLSRHGCFEGGLALPLQMHSTPGACQAYSLG